jgi:beta-aspartyl-peptidase (threonine type)
MSVTSSWQRLAPDGPSWTVLVHGGAGAAERDQLRVLGCRRAAAEAGALLRRGASALDAVQLAVRMLEDDPLFNAGTGACLDEDGEIALDAAIMDGASLRAGAVCALPPFQNPIDIARAALDDGTHVLYAGHGAARFAEARGFVASSSDAMTTPQARQMWLAWKQRTLIPSARPTGTVGAVACDARGGVAAATSTGGTLGKRRGRVGDSPILGAGTFADVDGAASATGPGEGMLRTCLAKTAVDWLSGGRGCEEVARRAIVYLGERVAVEAGIILADRQGGLGFARSTAGMAWAALFRGAEEPLAGS